MLVLLASCALAAPRHAVAQEPARDGTPILRVEIRGLETISEGFVRRIIRTRAGQPYLEQQVAEDVRELLRARKFLAVFASPPAIEDGQVVIVFNVQEKPVIRTVELEGNKNFSNDDLFKELGFAAGSVLDRFQIDQGRDALLRKYREAGYYYVQVDLDETALSSEARVVYKIIEGPRVRVRRIEFEGARAFPRLQLRLKVRTPTSLWIFRTGAFDEEQAERDAAELQSFYRGEGFLDARVGYRLDFTDVERTDLTLVFVIEEGPRYVIKDIPVSGNAIFDTPQILATISLKPGEFMREEALKQDVKKLEDLYGEIGFVDTRVLTNYAFLEDEPGVVVLELEFVEGPRSRFGRITVRGNTHTKDEVVRRELRFYPDEDYNTVKARAAERRVFETGLFKRATVTPLEDVDGYREALVEVEEGENIFFNVGVGISTDNGVVGTLTIENRNFDLFDWPRTWSEFFRGQAFRGDGQRLRFVLEPGTEVTRFRIDFTEPYLFDRPLRYDQSLYFFLRQRESYDEERLGFVPSLGKRFETGPLANWAVEGALRVEGVKIDDVNALAANDIRDVRGDSFLTSVKATIARDTTDSRIVPTKGHRFSMAWEQVGALGGDYDFGRPSRSFAWYKTLQTDALD
ncbi:MAG: outer membrane protein assembly factor BamA, partial [Pseudorhodoplanes sp.]|nr:outer membrane protein assembly factor BamA [Pseudorhodoplanes sp.]